jgi:hypothetical protein
VKWKQSQWSNVYAENKATWNKAGVTVFEVGLQLDEVAEASALHQEVDQSIVAADTRVVRPQSDLKTRTEARVARFFSEQFTNTGKTIPNYHKLYLYMVIKYIKWPQNRSNVHKIYYHLPMQSPPKFTQIAIFGLKIYYLATLTVALRPILESI